MDDSEEEEEHEKSEDEEDKSYKVGEPQSETPELGETEIVPPPPVESPPEIPLPPPKPACEDVQPLHPLDQTFYTDLYARIGCYIEELGRRTHISVTPEPPEPVVLPKFPEGVLSPIRGGLSDTYGKVFWNPVLIPSDSEEDPSEDEA